mmetsp:Transcript_1090/g.2062  ORF Transcript_1090/g.2062 Transcript_1090/m.2062 type:complete len:272 (-) Transcript_1090:369-1184(-)|eukprot:CAMPEP_0170182098 /NCGR_PEP_ID=MMETSP0040_2-20121228/26942_1 /TAXON_ID=641309 /ORGANISM="Lotharella oceanica, Strain CCMP622" /LENGTH=271 /DNA_ID=CAMNT_0010427397 /DNA_START=296 /DNA_END=1111 /DNA_ORIENTATION=+
MGQKKDSSDAEDPPIETTLPISQSQAAETISEQSRELKSADATAPPLPRQPPNLFERTQLTIPTPYKYDGPYIPSDMISSSTFSMLARAIELAQTIQPPPYSLRGRRREVREDTKSSSSRSASDATAPQVPSQSSGKKEAKRKRRKRRQKSPDAPKHPMSPFLHFAKQNASTIPVAESLAKGKTMSILGKRWRGMSEEAKSPYVQKAEAEKEVYKEKIKAYKAAKKKRIGGLDRPQCKKEGNEKNSPDDDESNPDTGNPASLLELAHLHGD